MVVSSGGWNCIDRGNTLSHSYEVVGGTNVMRILGFLAFAWGLCKSTLGFQAGSVDRDPLALEIKKSSHECLCGYEVCLSHADVALSLQDQMAMRPHADVAAYVMLMWHCIPC